MCDEKALRIHFYIFWIYVNSYILRTILHHSSPLFHVPLLLPPTARTFISQHKTSLVPKGLATLRMYYFKVKRVKTNHIFMESTPPTVAVCRRQLLSFRGMSSYHAVIGMSSLLENVDERTDLRGRYRPIGPSSVKAIWREGENNLFVISAPSWYEHKTQTGRVDPGYLHLSLFDFKGQKLLKGSNFSLFISKKTAAVFGQEWNAQLCGDFNSAAASAGKTQTLKWFSLT